MGIFRKLNLRFSDGELGVDRSNNASGSTQIDSLRRRTQGYSPRYRQKGYPPWGVGVGGVRCGVMFGNDLM